MRIRDASKVPADAEPLEWVDLYTWQSHSGGHSVARLATNVDPRSGSINVNVPAGLPVGNYWIVCELIMSLGMRRAC